MKVLMSIAVASLVMFSGCGDDKKSVEKISTEEKKLMKAELGEKLFFDKSISRDRKTSCSTCHDPEHGFIDARFSKEGADQNIFVHGAFSVGDDDISLGGRNAPTASYAKFSPEFHKREDGTYKGGQFHDGRADSLQVQAGGPPLDGAEMQMADKNEVIDRIKENSEYVEVFKKLYGTDIFDDVEKSYDSMANALAKFEKTEQFSPFDSKYDRYLAGEYSFTPLEDLGYSLFFSQLNTNCATCHTLNSSSEASSRETFTNYEYENIGTPRNIAAMDARAALGLQSESAVFDGLGGTIKNTDANYKEHLGKTKVPTLRNIAVTAPYMNNGVFKELRTVLEFYDHMAGLGHHTNPETGEAWGTNDHSQTINHAVLEATKELSDNKIKALEAFLRTLTDAKYEHLLSTLKE
ncbi:MAG: cytochrome c peroxidase [Campylobacterota bacterium]|nr:cytochrome c peroxidase [Campylobacterota bacterium]